MRLVIDIIDGGGNHKPLTQFLLLISKLRSFEEANLLY
jgi:hypothetical protein